MVILGKEDLKKLVVLVKSGRADDAAENELAAQTLEIAKACLHSFREKHYFNYSDIEDIEQGAAIKCLSLLEKFNAERTAWGSFVWMITTKAFYDYIRRGRRYSQILDDFYDFRRARNPDGHKWPVSRTSTFYDEAIVM